VKNIQDIAPTLRIAHHYKFYESSNEGNRYGYCYAFHLFDGGQGTVTVGSKRYPVRRGSLFYIPPTHIHGFQSSHEDPLSSYNIYCELWTNHPMETKQHVAYNTAQIDSQYLTTIMPCEELEHFPSVVQIQQHPRLVDLFIHITRVYSENGLYKNEISASLLYGWILEFHQICRSAQPFDPRIQRIIEKMESHSWSHDDEIDWQIQSGLQKTHFYNLFKQMTGLSPKAYLLKIKMRRAAATLLESNRSITDISLYLGYASIHYFTKQFTAYFGVSPTQFRNRH
jgi:AraC family transcriptional activator of mtrCDE